MPRVFAYLTAAELRVQPMEAKLVLVFVAMESLKTTYAVQAGLERRGAFYYDPVLNCKYNFARLLKRMLAEASMQPALTRVVRLRNKLVHTGLAGTSFEASWRMYERMQDIVREYLLRLLGYTGKYLTYGGLEEAAL